MSGSMGACCRTPGFLTQQLRVKPYEPYSVKLLQWHGSEVVVVALVAEFCCWLYPDTAADAHQGLMLHDTEEHLGVWGLAAVLWASRHSS